MFGKGEVPVEFAVQPKRTRWGRLVGLTRKLMSVSTLGAVDFRSDRERIAAHTRGNKKAVKQQNKLLKKQNELLKRQGQ